MAFNEDTRVKIPALLHLSRLGYKYISLKNTVWDFDTNIFTEIFKTRIQRINDDVDDEQVQRLLEDIKLELDFEDLGKRKELQNFTSVTLSFLTFKIVGPPGFEPGTP